MGSAETAHGSIVTSGLIIDLKQGIRRAVWVIGRRSTADPPQADFATSTVPPAGARLSLDVRPDPPNAFGGSYESECRPEGPYGAL